MTTEIAPADPADVLEALDEFFDGVRESIATSGDGPPRLAAGTFALYAMEDGGLMFVTDVAEGVLAGQKHTRIPPGMIRAVTVLANGGSKLAALKALAGWRQPKAIERGE